MTEVVAWDPYDSPRAKLRRSHLRALLGTEVQIHHGRLGSFDDGWQTLVEPDSEALRALDEDIWGAATSPDPKALAELRSGPRWAPDVARALLLHFPRADTGLDAWEHALLDAYAEVDEHLRCFTRALTSYTPGNGPLLIGDLVLFRKLEGLALLGLIEGCDCEDPVRWTPHITKLGRSLQLGEASVASIRSYGQIGGVSLRTGRKWWCVRDHEDFVLELIRLP